MANSYYDTVTARGGGKSSLGTQTLAAHDAPIARGAGRTLLAVTSAFSEVVTARGAGRTQQADALHHAEVVQASGAGRSTATDAARFRDAPISRGAGQVSALNLLAGREAPTARGAGKAQQIGLVAIAEFPTARGAGKVANVSALTMSEILTARGAGRTASVETARLRDLPTARGAGSSSIVLARSISETVTARGGGKGGGTDQFAGSDAPVARGAGKAVVTITTRFDVANLVRNVRANAKAALPECSKLLEALPDQVYLKTATLPFLVMLWGQPQVSGDTAVNDVGQTVPCDFIYVAHLHADGETDNSQAIRAALIPLESALLADYRQKAGTGAPSCNGTRSTAFPTARWNEYNRHFQEIGQGLCAMVSTFEFMVLESVLT